MNIGEKISSKRKELGLTLEDVGKAVGVGKSTVLKWESGYISNMRRDKIALLAKVLKMNPTELIDPDDNISVGNSLDAKLNFVLTEHEKQLILAYRRNQAMQQAVDKLLGLEDTEVLSSDKKHA